MKKIVPAFQIYFLNLLFLFLSASLVIAQDNSDQLNKARQLRADGKFDESLDVFQSLLKNDSNNVEYLHNTAYLLCKMGNRKKEETERQNIFRKAEYLSKKAITINNSSGEAHYTYALALGRIND
jgi:tetratricopeptide (TPR) repeat protein